MPAYFAKDAPRNEPARNIPAFQRLRPGSKWNAVEGTANGERGIIAYLGDPPEHGSTGWETCADGLLYLPGRPMPAQVDLVRSHRVDGINYTTSRGVIITIPIAAASPRKLLFGKQTLGDPSEDFARRAFALFDRLAKGEKVAAVDPEILGIVADAIGHAYYVTPEMLDELGWITSADLDPIVCCLMGADPKAVQPAGGSSPSPAGA